MRVRRGEMAQSYDGEASMNDQERSSPFTTDSGRLRDLMCEG